MAIPHEDNRVPHGRSTAKIVVVHVKLTAQDRNALKAALSLEGKTMQEYFAAKAAEKIASARRSS